MKLFYYEAPTGNVGDDLNAWLWPQLLSNILDDDSSHLIVGIGTLLNSKLPHADKYTILSSGLGYHDAPKYDPYTWDVKALRGPLTQKALKVETNTCLLDGGYLMPRFFQPEVIKKHKLGYIPHIDSINHGRWEDVCSQAEMYLLDPRWPVEKFISELSSCEQVVTEAMHGAILADAYSIPWQPTKAYSYINEFKWQDWANSLDMSVKFNHISSTWAGDINQPLKRKVINNIKRSLKTCGLSSSNWTPVLPSRSSEKRVSDVAESLKVQASSNQFYLSNEQLKNNRTDLLLEEVNKLNNT